MEAIVDRPDSVTGFLECPDGSLSLHPQLGLRVVICKKEKR